MQILLGTGTDTEVEFLINSVLLSLLTVICAMYANGGSIFNEDLTYTFAKVGIYGIIGVSVGLLVGYFIWLFSQTPAVRSTDWLTGLIVYGILFLWCIVTIWVSIGLMWITRNFIS